MTGPFSRNLKLRRIASMTFFRAPSIERRLLVAPKSGVMGVKGGSESGDATRMTACYFAVTHHGKVKVVPMSGVGRSAGSVGAGVPVQA